MTPDSFSFTADLQRALDAKTKPIGSLGRLEQLAAQIATLQGTLQPSMSTCQLIIFGADHGIANQGVSAYPSEVTRQMVENLLAGGAAANVIADSLDIPVKIIDAGIKGDPIDHPDLINRRIAPGTADFSTGPAMTPDQYHLATKHGTNLFSSRSQSPVHNDRHSGESRNPEGLVTRDSDLDPSPELSRPHLRTHPSHGETIPFPSPSQAETNLLPSPSQGETGPASSPSQGETKRGSTDAICFGEIGIANTASASIIAHKILGLPLSDLVGPGTGLNPEGVQHKLAVLTKAAERTAPRLDAATALTEYGGFEIVMMAAAIRQAATSKRLVIIDGFIATAAAITAINAKPDITNALLFAHRSGERGHHAMLQALNVEPLLDLDMRLGEGTGALLAWPFVKAAAAILNNMATFQSAGVSSKL